MHYGQWKVGRNRCQSQGNKDGKRPLVRGGFGETRQPKRDKGGKRGDQDSKAFVKWLSGLTRGKSQRSEMAKGQEGTDVKKMEAVQKGPSQRKDEKTNTNKKRLGLEVGGGKAAENTKG